MRKLQLHRRNLRLAISGRDLREGFQQFFAPEDDSGFERCLGQDVLVIRELTLPTAGDESGSIREHEQMEFLFRAAGGKLDPSRLIRQA